MIPNYLRNIAIADDFKISELDSGSFAMPNYDAGRYYKDIALNNYFYALLVLRHYLKFISDYYFGINLGAKNVDLFILTPSVSSPMGPGSDSEAIQIKFGNLEMFLVDSSQFGFEPLLLNKFDKVYCYLPSMRGENPDARHLNQFFHCELEMKGKLDDLLPIIEGYIKQLCEMVFLMGATVKGISSDATRTNNILNKIIHTDKFPEITFDDAVKLLVDNGLKDQVNFTDHGRDIKSAGEIELMKILGVETPLWIKYFDRDRVAFYQKPDNKDNNKAINADLLFPPIIKGSFGGEIVGSGQRQDNDTEIYESLKRQNNISPKPYEWYIDLRRLPNYTITSGFGMGIERFIAWVLGKDNISHVIPYPRLKNIAAIP
jgi:asparaginyl-tRNA synthetase